MDVVGGSTAALVAGMLGTGAFAGLLAGLLGVGGGIVIVPALFQAFTLMGVEAAVRMHLAVGTSLATIILTSMSSARSHWRLSNIDVPLLRSWAPAILVGVLAGAVAAPFLPGEALSLIFAVIAVAVALYLVVLTEGASLRDGLPAAPWKQALGAFVGFFSVLMGIGGGTLSVPVLTVFGFPIRRAVGSAAAIGLMISVPGSLAFMAGGLGHDNLPPLSLGFVNLAGLVLIVPTSVAMAPLGARLGSKFPPRLLRCAFAAFLVASAIQLLWNLLR